MSADIEARNAYIDRRRDRFARRAQIREYTKTKRLRACGYWPTSKEGVDLHCREDDNVAYYAGLQACGSPWICPVCAAKIRQKHADQIADAALAWINAGRSLYSMMLTVPHDRSMRLAELWDFIRGAFRSLLSGRFWKSIKSDFGLEGFVRSTEVTSGANGWHPHIHILLFFDEQISPASLEELSGLIYERWRSMAEGAGYRTPKRDLFSIAPVRSAESVCQYLAKSGFFEDNPDFAVIESPAGGKARRVGLELARADLKDGRRAGRTPFQIIADFCANPAARAADLALWLEWEDESKGKRSVEWSRDTIYRSDGSYTFQSFKKRFGIEEQTDEELAQDEVGGAYVRTVSTWEWTALRATDRVGRLLEIAESHGKGGVEYYLEWLTGDFLQTGDLTALDELDALIERSQLVPKLAGG